VLQRELWTPYGFPVAREVQGWLLNPAVTAWPSALGIALLAFGLWAGPPLVAAGAGLLARRNPAPLTKPAGAPAPSLPSAAIPELVTLGPGRFLMGAAEGEEGANKDEYPQHEVRIDYRFAIGKYPVTFAQWDAALESGAELPRPEDNSRGRGDRPVINVSWEDAQAYVAWLNDQPGLTGKNDAYRLPSETEWEYARRAGTQTRYSLGDDFDALQASAWFAHNSSRQTQPVGLKRPNRFGLHDMHGNVWEWCLDPWHGRYIGAPADGSVWRRTASVGPQLRPRHDPHARRVQAVAMPR